MKLTTLLFLVLSNICVIAQNSTIPQKDTLKSILKQSKIAFSNLDYEDAIINSSKLVEKGSEYDSFYYKFLGYDLLGRVYNVLEDSTRAKVNSQKALEIAFKEEEDTLISRGYLNLGVIYSYSEENYTKGIEYFKKSLKISEQKNLLSQMHSAYVNLSRTYLEHNEDDKAYINLLKAKAISEKHKIYSNVKTNGQLLLAKYYINNKNYNLAKRELYLSARKADKDSLIDLGSQTYNLLAELYSQTGDYTNAYSNLEKYNHYNQKKYALKKVQEIEKASAKFNLREYQKDLDVAKKEQQYSERLVRKSKELTTIFLVATVILLIALIGFFLLFKARKKIINKLQTTNLALTRAKEKAEKLSKVKTQFFSTVSHELRTPLYGVIGIASILQEDKSLVKHEQDLKSLKFSADYLLALVNDVLLINKIDAEAIHLEKIDFELDVLINSITRSFEFSLEQNKNKFHINIDKNIPNNLKGDPVRFSQILMNLVGNAIKFNENGNVWLDVNLTEVTDKGKYKILFTIKDDGIGIPKSKQDSIFEEFSQVENENYSYKGTGLGLSIVRKLLELHNSKVTLKSELGVGSEFSFLLNLEKNYNPTKSTSFKRDSLKDLDNAVLELDERTHILVVDDNKINQKITQKILKKHHFNSSVATDGQEAIDKTRAHNYSLILMDVNMPKVDGIEATIAIRKFNPDIPIIALTAVEMEEMRIKILDSGMNDIIAKPYDVSQFLSVILKNLSQAKDLG